MVCLKKGQKVDLTKGNAGLNALCVGLGWDEVEKKKGFLSSLFGGDADDIDVDASALVLRNGKLARNEDLVYYGNLRHASSAVLHMGDNLTGGGDGDDEQIKIYLGMLPPDCDRIVFVVNIYKAFQKQQHFGMVKNCFIRIVNDQTGVELMRYDLSENYDGMTGMIFGEVFRNGNEWDFSAIGQPTRDPGLKEMVARYQ